MLKPADEIYFWSGIMMDHAEFQSENLSTHDSLCITLASNFKTKFTILHSNAKTSVNSVNHLIPIESLVNDALSIIVEFIDFKRFLVRSSPSVNADSLLTPAFLGHMISEALEFQRTLLILKKEINIENTAEIIHLHKVWLPDAWGHAASIASQLDSKHKLLIKIADRFKNSFAGLYSKVYTLAINLEKINPNTLSEITLEIEKTISHFIEFLGEISSLKAEYLLSHGNNVHLIPEHMTSEEKYYLSRLKSISC